MDDDDKDVFKRTVDWGVRNALTTATYHIQTPYPGTRLFKQMQQQKRMLHYNWDLYDTRHVVFKTKGLSASDLQEGYDWSYKEFYRWSNIWKASMQHKEIKRKIKHLSYAGGWKKMEPVWNFIIKTRRLNKMLPLLESILSGSKSKHDYPQKSPFPAIA